MTAEELSARYIATMERTLIVAQRVQAPIAVSEKCLDEIFGYVKAYLDDAKYFRVQGKFETSLVSIAYCEGLLDALKLMGAVNISTEQR